MHDLFAAPFLIFAAMNYSETIDFLFTRLPLFSRIGVAAYKKDLTNTLSLCEFLNNPQHQFKSIHIAGTNGKGSVSHILAAIFHSAGYKTGLYTSPHLFDFRERIKISSTGGKLEEVPEKFVIDFTEKIIPQIEKISPSFFELTVAMAFDFFAKEKVEIAIIETGLGGRLDSTNVITPELSVITNISYDHTAMLGNTLTEIAFEKAGIIKNKVPVVIGEANEDTAAVFSNVAKEKNADLFFATETRKVTDWSWEHHFLQIEIEKAHHTDREKYQMDLQGLYQTKNLLTVLEAVTQLRQIGWNIDEHALRKGLQNTKKISGLKGRWDILHSAPLVIADVAHNEGGIRQLLQQIELTPHQNLHIVFGMVKDKNIDEVLNLLPQNASYYFSRAQVPRALPEGELKQKASAFHLMGDSYPNVNIAIQAALENAKEKDLIVICGSIFLVGEIQAALFENFNA